MKKWPVKIRLGQIELEFVATGPRKCKPGLFGINPSEPNPTQHVSILYENMYGGRSETDPQVEFPENPVGRGFLSKSEKVFGEQIGPQFEDIRGRIPTTPLAITPVHRAWTPRRELAGTLDEDWFRNRWPLFPDDFSAEFYQQAPNHLQLKSGFFSGDEKVTVISIGPREQFSFSLPDPRFLCMAIIDSEETRFQRFNLDTIVFQLEKMQLSLVWRTSFAPASNSAQCVIDFEE